MVRTALCALLAMSGVPAAAAQSPADAEIGALKELYRRPPARPVENPALADLGKALFWDPRVSASGKTSCGSCHLPDLAWATKDAKSRNDSGKLTSRKSQPVIGLGHAATPLNGWDGRNPTLEAQAKASVATGSMSMRETETPVKVEVIEARIRAVPEYAQKFEAALPGRPITLDTIVEAIAAYERTIEPGPAPFDAWVEGDEGAIPEAAKRGFALFNGKAACVACHSGWRFTDDGFHDIGSTTTWGAAGRSRTTRLCGTPSRPRRSAPSPSARPTCTTAPPRPLPT